MTKQIKLLDEIVVAAPCPVSWESMVGDNRVRLCAGCSRNVYNISAMTDKEAEEFLLKNGSTQCMQIYRRSDGKIMTDNCPRALRPLRDRCRLVMRIMSGIAASTLAFFPLSKNSASAQEAQLRGDVYVPPDKQSSAVIENKSSTQQAGAASGNCKKIMLGPDDCSSNKPNNLPVKGEAVLRTPVMSPGMVAFPLNLKKGASPLEQKNNANLGSEKPDLRDSRSLKLYLSARNSESEGKTMLAQTQYIEALKAAAEQKDGDPKFKLMILESCNKLRQSLKMPSVDIEGKEIRH